MMSSPNQETIRLLDKEYTVACPPAERDGLLESARLLDGKMREIRSRGKVVGNEKVIVMAALNVVHELLQSRHNQDQQEMLLRLRLLQDKIETALEQEERQLSL